jgi:hypothetical protein
VSVTCPYCGLELPDPQVITCPHCSQPLTTNPLLDPEEPTLPKLRITRVSHPLSVHDMHTEQMDEPAVPEAEPVIPEPVIPEPVIPEPVIPEPVIPEPVIPEPVIPEPVVPEARLEVTQPAATAAPAVWEAQLEATMPPAYLDRPIYVPPAEPLLPLPPDLGPSWGALPSAHVHPSAKRNRTVRILVGLLLLAVVVASAGVYYVVSHNPVIYQSSLKGSLDNWEIGADCAPKSDGYHIMSGSICYAPIGSQTDADIKVDVVQQSGSTELFYGIVLRSTPREHYYLFGIDGNGKWLFVNVPSTSQLPVSDIAPTLESALHSGLHEVNKLEVKMKGSHFDFFINGAKVGEINDSHYATGQIGLSGEDGVEVVYTDLSIVKVN